MRPTRKLGRAVLKHSPIWSCTGWGLQSFPGHPGNWCALTAPFHPYPAKLRGGILSVALSFALPRLHVMEHPALWCSDFPLNHRNDPAIVCAAPAGLCFFPVYNSLTVRAKLQSIGTLKFIISLRWDLHVASQTHSIFNFSYCTTTNHLFYYGKLFQ